MVAQVAGQALALGLAACSALLLLATGPVLTAFGQRTAGSDIALEPATTSWRDWSQRCAALAAHPAVLDQRGYWIDNEATASVRLADAGDSIPPGAGDLVRVATALTPEQTSQVDNARRILQASTEEILLAALARSLAVTVDAPRVNQCPSCHQGFKRANKAGQLSFYRGVPSVNA